MTFHNHNHTNQQMHSRGPKQQTSVIWAPLGMLFLLSYTNYMFLHVSSFLGFCILITTSPTHQTTHASPISTTHKPCVTINSNSNSQQGPQQHHTPDRTCCCCCHITKHHHPTCEPLLVGGNGDADNEWHHINATPVGWWTTMHAGRGWWTTMKTRGGGKWWGGDDRQQGGMTNNDNMGGGDKQQQQHKETTATMWLQPMTMQGQHMTMWGWQATMWGHETTMWMGHIMNNTPLLLQMQDSGVLIIFFLTFFPSFFFFSLVLLAPLLWGPAHRVM